MKVKEYICVEVSHHKEIGRTIAEFQSNGWCFLTYQAAGMGGGPLAYNVKHYLLFERDK